jgi:hypothetical protein
MPLHDWSRVPAGLFHHLHQNWSVEIARMLNRGLLPAGISALVEQRTGPREADVLAIEQGSSPRGGLHHPGDVAVAEPPATRFVRRTERDFYADRANRIVLKHHLGRTIAVIEIVSPGNKDSRGALREFVEKTVDYLRAGVHALVVDVLPPTRRDPCGIHKVIWDEVEDEDFTLPEGKNRVLASYETGDVHTAYVEVVGVGDVLPDMPLFLASGWHILVPLEAAYRVAWEACPEALRTAVETGVVPEPDVPE